MARFKLGKLKQKKKSWKDTIVDRIGQGKVLPFVSNAIGNDIIFGSYTDLLAGWADYTDYPYDPSHTLTQMAQYQSVMAKADPDIKADNTWIKEIFLDFLARALASIADEELVEELEEDPQAELMNFSELAGRLESYSLTDPTENPLLLLADLPLPIFITTSYHTLLESALQKAGKQPRTVICRWNQQVASLPEVLSPDDPYEPTSEEPLVFHLFGIDKYADSMVLTEDDYLDFMVAISQDIDAIPLRVRHALADSSLVMLGYHLDHWDFRVIFRGMVKTITNQRRPKSVAIQLVEEEAQRSYYKNYLSQEAEFEVFWGDSSSFVNELWKGWQS